MEQKWYHSKVFRGVLVGLLATIYAICCMFLFRSQLIQETDNVIPEILSHIGINIDFEPIGNYQTDLSVHVAALEMDIAAYSILFYIFDWFYRLPGSSFLVSALLAFFCVGTVFLLKKLLKELDPKGKPGIQWLLAWGCTFVAAIFLPNLTNRYLGTFSPSIWHNSTYLGMRFFAVISLIYYFKMNKTYMEKINWKHWWAFCISTTLSMAIKPSFVFCFSPIMAIFLARDLIKSKGKAFKNIFLFGLAVIPSIIIGVVQLGVLKGVDHGTFISFMRVLGYYSATPFIAIISSIFFPIMAFLLIGKYLWKYEDIKIILFAFLFGTFQAMFFAESGPGAFDGNYLWGALTMNFFLFAVIANRLYGWCREKLLSAQNRKRSDVVIACLLWGSFGLHIYYGLEYFYLLLQGGYFQ